MRSDALGNDPAVVRAKRSSPGLSEAEVGIIDLFVAFSRILGQPRSVAEIYGLLFASSSPLALDDITTKLKMSKGSASQGVRYLRQVGAIKPAYQPQDRRTHFEAVAHLRRLAGEFLRVQVQPVLEEGDGRVARIMDAASRLPRADREHITGRVRVLQSWGRNTRKVFPLILRVLGE